MKKLLFTAGLIASSFLLNAQVTWIPAGGSNIQNPNIGPPNGAIGNVGIADFTMTPQFKLDVQDNNIVNPWNRLGINFKSNVNAQHHGYFIDDSLVVCVPNLNWPSTQPHENIFVGVRAGINHSGNTGKLTFIGYSAGASNVNSAGNNTFIGFRAGEINWGGGGTFVGVNTGKNSVGSNNTFVGEDVGFQNNGAGNSFFGKNSGRLSNSNYNAFYGNSSGEFNRGAYNVYIGNATGGVNTFTQAANNVIVGGYDGAFGWMNSSINQNNTYVGSRAGALQLAALNNSGAFGESAIVRNNFDIIIGNNNVQTGIGLSNNLAGPANKLELNCDIDVPFTPFTATTPFNALIPGSWPGATGASGLRFRDLTSASTPVPVGTGSINPSKVLSVDGNGDVVLISASGGNALGGPCPSTNSLTGDYEIPLNNWVFNFTAPPLTVKSQVMIGLPVCSSNSARLSVFDDIHGKGIYGYSSIIGGNQIGIHGNGTDPANTNNIVTIGVLGETNGTNSVSKYAGVAGFCGAPGVFAGMPPGMPVGVYGDEGTNTFCSNFAGYFNGNVQINGSACGGWALYVNGPAFATGGWMVPSDNRFKKEIKKLESVNDKIKKLSGYTYKYKTEEFTKKQFDKTEQIGLIAQELKEVFPQLVKEDKEGYLAINYQGMIPVLLEALKEQQQQIDELKTLVQSLAVGNSTPGAINTNPQSIALSDKNIIVLNQNVPNPFAESTVITYNIPNDFTKAQLIFTTSDGKVIRIVEVTSKGEGRLNVFANDLSNGMYTYTLVVDGKSIDTKKMVKQN